MFRYKSGKYIGVTYIWKKNNNSLICLVNYNIYITLSALTSVFVNVESSYLHKAVTFQSSEGPCRGYNLSRLEKHHFVFGDNGHHHGDSGDAMPFCCFGTNQDRRAGGKVVVSSTPTS